MGIYDRDYARDDGATPVQIRWPQTAVIQILTLCVIVVLADMVVSLAMDPDTSSGKKEFFHFMTRYMAATPQTALNPLLWWQFVTHGFAHSPRSLAHIVFNMFGLWLFGRQVEGKYGKSEFWRIYVLALILGGIFWSLRTGFATDWATQPRHLVVGASGAVTAIVMLFVFNFPNEQLYLMGQVPIKAWIVGVIVIALNLFPIQLTEESKNVAYDVHLVGAAFAAMYFYSHLHLGKLLGFGGGRSSKRRPKLKVHNPDSEVDYSGQNDLADRLLDKVRDQGEDSLTAKERKVLEDYSRRMRQKHR